MEDGNESKRPRLSGTQEDLVRNDNQNDSPLQRSADQTDEDDRVTPRDGQVVDSEITRKSSHDTAEEDNLDYLESRATELSQETSMLSDELRRLATRCMEINDENAVLLDEIRQLRGDIENLEAMDPQNNRGTDEESGSQITDEESRHS